MVNRVKEIRELLNMSQDELSKKSGVSRTVISKLETGKPVRVTNITLEKLSDALGRKVSEIFW